MWFITCLVSLPILWMKELFRDHKLDDFCKGLCKGLRKIGRDARVSGWDWDTRVVEIRGSPIARVKLEKTVDSGYGGGTTYQIFYEVPDDRIKQAHRNVSIRTKRVRKFPLFGEIVGLY